MSCRVQDGAKVANDGSKRKPQTQFPSRRMSGHCDWRSSSGFLHWLSTSATPPRDGETGRDRSPGTPPGDGQTGRERSLGKSPGTEGGHRNVHSRCRSSRWRHYASIWNDQMAPAVPQRRRPCQVEGQKKEMAPANPRRGCPCQVESQKQGRLNKKTAGLCSPAVLKLIALILT